MNRELSFSSYGVLQSKLVVRVRVRAGALRMLQHVAAAGPVPASRVSFVPVSTSLVPPGHLASAAARRFFAAAARAETAAVEGAVVRLQRSHDYREGAVLQTIGLLVWRAGGGATDFDGLAFDGDAEDQFAGHVGDESDGVGAVAEVLDVHQEGSGDAGVSVADLRWDFFAATV